MIVRQIKNTELNQIEILANSVYTNDLYESFDSFYSKIKGYDAGCFVADIDGTICGYIISFPFLLHEVFPLDHHYYLVAEPDCLYVHDLCVLPEFQGRGIGKRLFEVACSNNKDVGLVAVLNSENFWHKLGFESIKKIMYNNVSATYMIRKGI